MKTVSAASLGSICVDFEDSNRHAAFFDFVPKVFGQNADFLRWYQAGGWDSRYRSFALLTEAGEIVANVSVTQMNLVLEGEPLRGFQFGAVGTVPAWRDQGLQRRLLDEVIEVLEPQADLLLLFANDRVVDFYPRFGFQRQSEQVFGDDHAIVPGPKVAPLELGSPESQALLRRLCRSARPVTGRFGAYDYGSVLFWHVLSYFARDVFYFPEHDAVIVARRRERTLTLFDILSTEAFDLAPLLAGIVDEPIERLEFEFAPERWWPSAVPVRPYTDSPLFVRSSRSMPIEPFKFPTLAHT